MKDAWQLDCSASLHLQGGAVDAMKDLSRAAEQPIFCRTEDIAVTLDSPVNVVSQLPPRLQRRRDVEWLGIIQRAKGELGGLGRLKATGALVEVFGRSISIVRPSIAAAVRAAVVEQLRVVLGELNDSETERRR